MVAWGLNKPHKKKETGQTMLYGRYEHNIDAKGRIFVPAKLREKLGDCFIAAAVMDHCVSLYSMEEWDKLQQGLAEMPFTKARKLQRYLSSNAADVQVDSQGRILLPRHLLGYASLQKRALVIGAGNRAEIWNPEGYETESLQMTPEEVENEFMELGF
ncbi:MAG TPA: division/cell wall cluster transcriptional repressor MraZ [Ruminococcaceae bacterium]|nr:division/cell wall cluster transcriptional repressor MraZ [Oscillospiraceae bacterium]